MKAIWAFAHFDTCWMEEELSKKLKRSPEVLPPDAKLTGRREAQNQIKEDRHANYDTQHEIEYLQVVKPTREEKRLEERFFSKFGQLEAQKDSFEHITKGNFSSKSRRTFSRRFW